MGLTPSPPQNIAVTIAPSTGAGCLTGSMCPPGSTWKIAAQEEFNGTGLDPNGPLTSTTGWCCGNGFWNDNSGDGTGLTPTFTGSTVILHAYSNGTHGCGPNAGSYCGGNGYTWKGTTGPGYYEARIKDGPQSNYKVFWLLIDNGDCTGGGAYLTNGFEADMKEAFGGASSQVNIFWGGYGSCSNQSPTCCFNAADAFHLWGLEWPDINGGLTYWRDGVAIKTVTGPVENKCCILSGLNGGIETAGAKGQTDGGTMEVDWVRYYQKQ